MKTDTFDDITEGIEREVLINPDIESISDNEMDSQQLIIKCAIKKRKELAEKYQKVGSKVNPLVLIQIPNSEVGEDKKNCYII